MTVSASNIGKTTYHLYNTLDVRHILSDRCRSVLERYALRKSLALLDRYRTDPNVCVDSIDEYRELRTNDEGTLNHRPYGQQLELFVGGKV